MKVFLGYKRDGGATINWNLESAVNPHAMIVGPSGTGKTFNLGKIIEQLCKFDDVERIYVFDVHGDIGGELPQEYVSSISYSEISKNGINPLTISTNMEFGGPRKKIRSFVSLLNNTSRPLGNRQEATLTRVLEDLYQSKGIYADKPETWRNKSPEIGELRSFLSKYTEMVMTGSTYKLSKNVSKLNSRIRALRAGYRDDDGAPMGDIESLKQSCIDAYATMIQGITSGTEMDNFMKFDSEATLQSLLDRIVAIESTGVFRGGGEKFDKTKKIYRFDLKTLLQDEQLLFISTMAEIIYARAMEKGIADAPREFMVVDEAQLFITNDKDNPLNLIATGARKFGLGLIMASQSLHHFSDDLLTNTGFKLILGVDESFQKKVANKINFDVQSLGSIQARVSGIINIKSKNPSENSGWIDLVFNRKNAMVKI